jgi:hypothetical protein
MFSAGFDPAIPANERPQTYALDPASTGIGTKIYERIKYSWCNVAEFKPIAIHTQLSPFFISST